jgi:hypothetical protein
MRERIGIRARTDFDVVAHDGSMPSHCRAIDISASGVRVDRGRQVRASDERLVVDLELVLAAPLGVLRAKGRSVWSHGTQQAFRFIALSDVDRLTIAEHLDRQRLQRRAAE